jgi:hypothetical protein
MSEAIPPIVVPRIGAMEYVDALRITSQQQRNAAADYARKARSGGTMAMRMAYLRAERVMIASAEHTADLAAFWEETLAEYPERTLVVERFA